MKLKQLSKQLIQIYVGLSFCLSGTLALADSYPTKPIKAIVPFAPGSATDQIGRAFAAKMAESLGQPVVVENRPGANGMIGADQVAKSPADGYTLLFGTNSTNAALKSLVKNLPYNQDTAFTPIGYFGSVPLIVAINNDVPAKSLNGFVSLAKADPGKMTFAYASTSQRVSSEMLASVSGIKMTGVSYKSGPNAMTDLIGGQVNMFTADFAVTLPQVQAGKIRGLAVTSLKRSPAIPELPTVNEALGIKGYELIAFFAAFGPAGMLWCNVKPHTAMASSSGLGFPIAAAATIGYMYGSWGNPNLPAGSLGFVYIPAVLCIVAVSIFTAPLGAKMARKLNVAQLKRIFGVMLFMLAAFMFNESRKAFGF